MIPLPGIRDKGAGPQLGARQPGEQGPFGPYDDGDQDNEDDPGQPGVSGYPGPRAYDT